MEKKSNVIQVPPRRIKVTHHGLHGWVELIPSTKEWRWTLNTQVTIKQDGIAKGKDEAITILKKFLEAASHGSKHVRTVD